MISYEDWDKLTEFCKKCRDNWEYRQGYVIFPRKCYLTGRSTGWFANVMICENIRVIEVEHLPDVKETRYIRADEYLMKVLKDDF